MGGWGWWWAPTKKISSISRGYQIYCLGILLVINLLNQADQWALPTLQASGLQCSSCPSKTSSSFYQDCRDQCLNLDDVAMGFLTGPAFTLSAVLASLPLGWMADRYHRNWILCMGLILWSGSTVAASFTEDFWFLALCRIALGIGGASVNPTAYSMLSDYFSPEVRALVLAIFSMAIYMGELVGLLSAFISEHYSWRVAFVALGVPGFVMAAILALTVREPARGMSEERSVAGVVSGEGGDNEEDPLRNEEKTAEAETRTKEEESVDSSLIRRVYFLLHLPAFVCHCIVATIRNMGGYALGAWLQVFLVRVHGLTPSEYTIWLMIIIPLGGGLGATLGGIIADRWHKHDIRGKVWMIALSQLIAAPCIVGFFLVPNYIAALIILFPSYVFAEMWYGPSTAVVQDLIPPSIRGLATAIYFIVTSLGALAPLIVGGVMELVDKKAPHSEENSSSPSLDPTYPLVAMVGGSYLLAAGGFLVTSYWITRHSTRMEAILQPEGRFCNIIPEKEKNIFLFFASERGRKFSASLKPMRS